jgi:hypothetical protein
LAAAALLLPAVGVVAGPAGAALADPGDLEIAVTVPASVLSTIGTSNVCIGLYDANNHVVPGSDICWQPDASYKPGHVLIASTLMAQVGAMYRMYVTVDGHPEFNDNVLNVQASATGNRSVILELGTNKITVSDTFQY